LPGLWHIGGAGSGSKNTFFRGCGYVHVKREAGLVVEARLVDIPNDLDSTNVSANCEALTGKMRSDHPERRSMRVCQARPCAKSPIRL